MGSEIDYRRIGRHFRTARQKLNLKQKDVAELIGVSDKTCIDAEVRAEAASDSCCACWNACHSGSCCDFGAGSCGGWSTKSGVAVWAFYG